VNKDARNDLAQLYFQSTWDELGAEEQRVLETILSQSVTSRDVADVMAERASFGERLADRVAQWGGSWSFIIAFSLVLLFWMVLNSEVFTKLGLVFDPYPFIFLNLVLSTLAAVQAPIIMMSQNRQAVKDRLAASVDFETNLRAEIEILRLHAKIDGLVCDQLNVLARQQAELLAQLRPENHSE
jgi:uncharacterized membrane protein